MTPQELRDICKEDHHDRPGYHFYKGLVSCPNKQFHESNFDGEVYDLNGIDIGTMDHAFLEYYYLNPDLGPFAILNSEPWCKPPKNKTATIRAEQEAKRLASYYFDNHPRNEFVEIIEAEQRYALPDSLRKQTILTDLPYSFTKDLLAIPDPDIFEYTRGVEVEKDAVYVVDHKFIKALRSNLVTEYQNSLQFVLYNLAAQALYPEYEIRGPIVNVVIKNKVTENKEVIYDLANKVIKVFIGFLLFFNFL